MSGNKPLQITGQPMEIDPPVRPRPNARSSHGEASVTDVTEGPALSSNTPGRVSSPLLQTPKSTGGIRKRKPSAQGTGTNPALERLAARMGTVMGYFDRSLREDRDTNKIAFSML